MRWRQRKRISLCARILLTLVLIAAASFAALEGIVLAGGRTVVSGQPQIMIIFGCQVKPWGPSILLQDRLDTALEYLEERPDVTVVVTGGRGADEHISEAQCMYDYLTQNGIDGSRILMESRSHNTDQNIRYSIELLAEEGYDTTGDILLVSNDFHLARVKLL